MRTPITSHQLARKLLEMRDLPICVGDRTPNIGWSPLSNNLDFQIEEVLGEGGVDETVLFVNDNEQDYIQP